MSEGGERVTGGGGGGEGEEVRELLEKTWGKSGGGRIGKHQKKSFKQQINRV